MFDKIWLNWNLGFNDSLFEETEEKKIQNKAQASWKIIIITWREAINTVIERNTRESLEIKCRRNEKNEWEEQEEIEEQSKNR